MTYRFNNNKIRMYLRYQEKNFDKEKMMVTVKQTMDRWRKLFISQAYDGESKLGLIRSEEQKKESSPDAQPKFFEDDEKKSIDDSQIVIESPGKKNKIQSVKFEADRRESVETFNFSQTEETKINIEKSQEA